MNAPQVPLPRTVADHPATASASATASATVSAGDPDNGTGTAATPVTAGDTSATAPEPYRHAEPEAALVPTVAAQIADWLRSLGVRRAFAMHSHHLAPLLPALWAAGIRIHVAVTETGAGYMADGYARATGRLGVAITGGGPGVAMMMPALQTAVVERVPLLAIVGQSATTGVPPFQETGPAGSRDLQMLRGLLGPGDSVVGVAEVGEASEVQEALDVALDALRSGGPAAIAIPVDVQAEPSTQRMEALGHRALRPFEWRWGADCAAPPDAPAFRDGQAETAQPPVPYRDVLAAVATVMPDARIFVDAGQARHAAHAVLPGVGMTCFDCPQSAPMGWAIAAAVGAGLASPGRAPKATSEAMGDERGLSLDSDESAAPVVCVTGDGSAIMLGNEFATAVRYGATVMFVLCDNGVWGGPHGRHRGTPTAQMGYLPTVDWVEFSGSMGLPASRVESATELARALRGRRGPDGPHLFVVPTPAKDDEVVAPYAPRSPGPE